MNDQDRRSLDITRIVAGSVATFIVALLSGAVFGMYKMHQEQILQSNNLYHMRLELQKLTSQTNNLLTAKDGEAIRYSMNIPIAENKGLITNLRQAHDRLDGKVTDYGRRLERLESILIEGKK